MIWRESNPLSALPAYLSILPVLKAFGQSYRPLVIKQPYISIEPDFFTRTMLCDELSSILTVLGAIPDGLCLWNFPRHLEGAECWCRPQVSFMAGTLIVTHKDLDHGEFDC